MIKKLTATIVFLMLTSCKSTTFTSTEIDPNQPIKINKGIVAVHLVNNAEQLQINHKGWTEIFLVRTDNLEEVKKRAYAKVQAQANREAKILGVKPKTIDPKTVEWDRDRYSLTPHNNGVLNSQIFVGTVPAGEYIISSLYSFFDNGNMSSWLTMPVQASTGKFEVKGKQLTNLGSIVYQPLENIKESNYWQNSSSSKAYVTRIKQQQDLKQFIFKNYPDLANQLDLSQINSWLPDAYDSYRGVLSDLSRKYAYGDKTIPLNKFGKGMITAKLGLLTWQDNDYQWHKTQLDTNSELISALELENTILVGGELGQLFSGGALNGIWEKQQPVSAKEAIIWLGKGHEQNYAVTLTNDRYKIYTFINTESPWIETFSLSAVRQNLSPIVNRRGELILLKGRKQYHFDKKKKKWRESKKSLIGEALQLPSGAIVAIRPGLTTIQKISTNGGKTWEVINSPSDFFDFNSVNSFPSILKNKVVTLGSFNNQFKIISADINNVESKDAWTIHHDAKAGCTTMLPGLSYNKALYFLCDQGSIVETSNYGETWHETMVSDIDAMRKAYEAL